MTTTKNAGWWTRLAARGAAATVALVAGAASFEHIASVAQAAGERTWVAYSLPLAIDGLIVVGVTALIEDQRLGRRPRGIARVAVLVGVVATLAANLASAQPGWTARLVALAAPVSFLLSVEVLTRTGRRVSTGDDTSDGQRAQPTSDSEPAAPARSRATRTPAIRRRPTAAQRVAKAVQRTPDATAAEIAARLKVSERTVQRYWPGADTAPTEPSPNGGGSRPTAVAPVPAAAFEPPNGRPNLRDRSEVAT
jgi:hypothetical protein